jgi:hypothetical protein
LDERCVDGSFRDPTCFLPDAKGKVATIADFAYRRNSNIHADEHTNE